MNNNKDLKKTNELTIFEKHELKSVNFKVLREYILETGPLNIVQLVAYFKQYDRLADIDSVEKRLALWPLYFKKLDTGHWEGIPVEYNSSGKNKSGYIPGERPVKRSNKREYTPRPYPQPSNNQRVYKGKSDSHYLVIESDVCKRIGPYLKVEAKSVTPQEKQLLTDLSGKEDLLKVFLKNNDRYIFLGHRSILNHDEAPDSKALTLKFAPADDDLSMYHIEDKSTALIEQSDSQQYALVLPYEVSVPLPAQIVEKIRADYNPVSTNFQLFKDRYTHELSRLSKKQISADDLLDWLADEKSGASQGEYEKILRNLLQKKEFKNRLQLLDIAIHCVNDDSSIEFCNDFLDLIVKNINSDPNFKERAICFVDVLLLNKESLEKKHYKKIAKAYAQNGEWNNSVSCYTQAYAEGLNKNDLDYEFRSSFEKCDYEDVKDSIDILFNAGLLKAFDDKINDENSDEVFDLVISFYQFYKDKVRPEQNDLESFASSVLTTCALNNEWDNFDLFFDDIEAREKFMKKPEKKFDLLSVGEMAGLKDFIDELSGKYLNLINKNYNQITTGLKKELIEQIRFFESMSGSSESALSGWLKSTIKESKIAEVKIKPEDILKGFKKIFIIGGREETRNNIEKKLLGCGAERVVAEPPMSEKHIDKKGLKSKMIGCECAVFLTNYMGHAEYYMGKDIAHEAGIQTVHCSGGFSRLLVELGKLKR